MSERFSAEHARKPYRCRKCAEAPGHTSLDNDSQEPGTASENLRVLYVWSLCLGNNEALLPVSTVKVTVLMHAPPQAWGWARGGKSDNDAAAVGADSTDEMSGSTHKSDLKAQYLYTESQINAIWRASGPFAGTPAP